MSEGHILNEDNLRTAQQMTHHINNDGNELNEIKFFLPMWAVWCVSEHEADWTLMNIYHSPNEAIFQGKFLENIMGMTTKVTQTDIEM